MNMVAEPGDYRLSDFGNIPLGQVAYVLQECCKAMLIRKIGRWSHFRLLRGKPAVRMLFDGRARQIVGIKLFKHFPHSLPNAIGSDFALSCALH
jgi:hypothetical protein